MTITITQKCDRCGTEREMTSTANVKIGGWRVIDDTKGDNHTLCRECVHALTHWIAAGR